MVTSKYYSGGHFQAKFSKKGKRMALTSPAVAPKHSEQRKLGGGGGGGQAIDHKQCLPPQKKKKLSPPKAFLRHCPPELDCRRGG